MPPKAIVTAEEDVKFLLTVIKHLSQSGSVSVSLSFSSIRLDQSLTLTQPNWQQVADELGLPSASAA